jgi:hypothetical protein
MKVELYMAQNFLDKMLIFELIIGMPLLIRTYPGFIQVLLSYAYIFKNARHLYSSLRA